MTEHVTLRCRCGALEGRVQNASPATVNRVVCYCDDCQAFLHHLGRADMMDPHGGTEIVQVAPASVAFHRGAEHIAGLRLTPKGLYRWHASCCKTPIANTAGPGLPFVGIVMQVLHHDRDADALFGRPVGGVLGKFAIGTPPEGSTRFNVRLIARAIRLILGWRLTGRVFPHPFFDATTRAPSRPLITLTREERDALRPLCGPRPQ